MTKFPDEVLELSLVLLVSHVGRAFDCGFKILDGAHVRDVGWCAAGASNAGANC